MIKFLKNKKNILITVLVFLIVAFPLVSSAKGLVPCGGKGEEACTFGHILELISNVINFLLFDLAVPIAAIVFAYAGFLMLFSGGNPGARSRAKSMFGDVALGLVIALAAWLIITTILNILGYTGWNPFK